MALRGGVYRYQMDITELNFDLSGVATTGFIEKTFTTSIDLSADEDINIIDQEWKTEVSKQEQILSVNQLIDYVVSQSAYRGLTPINKIHEILFR